MKFFAEIQNHNFDVIFQKNVNIINFHAGPDEIFEVITFLRPFCRLLYEEILRVNQYFCLFFLTFHVNLPVLWL